MLSRIRPSSVLLATILAGCGGRVLEEASPSDAASDTNASVATDANAPSVDSTPTPTPAPDDGTGCQVMQVHATTSGGATVYTHTLSDPAPSATSAFIKGSPDGMFTVECRAGDAVRLRARFGPYVGLSDYALEVGTLEIEGRKSDRRCQVSISNAGPGVLRGFLSCPKEPYAESNVFALTNPPLGLGAFDAKVVR